MDNIGRTNTWTKRGTYDGMRERAQRGTSSRPAPWIDLKSVYTRIHRFIGILSFQMLDHMSDYMNHIL